MPAGFGNHALQVQAHRLLRDAIADVSVLELQLIGLDQSEWFDTVHLRVKAQMRDANRAQARYVLVVGDQELAKAMFQLKEMASGTERAVTEPQIESAFTN